MAATAIWRTVAGGTLIVALTATTGNYGRAEQRSSAQMKTERTLTILENEWAKAAVARDTKTFERLLAPGFIYTEDATLMSRADVISSMTAGPDRVELAANEDMKVHDFGNTAVVTGILMLRGRSKGAAFNRRYRYTDTWMLRNGRWQAVAAQDYLIPQ